jgi:hypothetical protein
VPLPPIGSKVLVPGEGKYYTAPLADSSELTVQATKRWASGLIPFSHTVNSSPSSCTLPLHSCMLPSVWSVQHTYVGWIRSCSLLRLMVSTTGDVPALCDEQNLFFQSPSPLHLVPSLQSPFSQWLRQMDALVVGWRAGWPSRVTMRGCTYDNGHIRMAQAVMHSMLAGLSSSSP